MSVRFILGRSGSGKTSYCISSIVSALLQDRDQPLILLVPEQATYQAERTICSHEQIAGYSRLHVLSFDRLQFMLLGRNTARPQVSRLGRQMIVHRILRDCRDQLRVFGSSADSVGMAARMADTISELHRYARGPEDLADLLAHLENDARTTSTALKFADIARILDRYLEFTAEKFIDPEMQLNRLCRAVPDADFLRSARLWVDGFSSFPAGELALLAELTRVAADTEIALCLDPSAIDLADPDATPPDQADIFYPTCRTYADLLKMLKSCNMTPAEPLLLDELLRFSSRPSLAHIERSIFTTGPSAIDDTAGVRIIAAANTRAEVRFAATEVRRLVDSGKFRYRDIAVIASDLDSYEHYVKASFDDLGLPLFIDRRTPLSRHPAALLVLSSLRAVIGGFSHSDIFTCLKTDLFGLDRDDVDLLENYCLAFGVTGGDWQGATAWNFADKKDDIFGQSRINRIRQRVADPLLQFKTDLTAEQTITVEQFTAAVFAYLDNLDFLATLDRWIESAHGSSDFAAVERHRQFYDRFVSIFDELADVFTGCRLSVEDFLAILTAAFSQLTLALIPPTQDQVLVGSVERSRHPDLKAVFLLGATQKQFPVPVTSAGILSDTDRAAAAEAEFELAPATTDNLAERRYLAYIAFTRPSELLYVTYPLADKKGTAVVRSQFIDELESLFTKLPAETPAPHGPAETVACRSQLADLLCSGLGADSQITEDAEKNQLRRLLVALAADEQLAQLAAAVNGAIDYDNHADLDKDTCEQLFQGPIRTSASRLTTFAACPFKYFAQYSLNLKKRKEFKLEPMDLGTFYHDVLDALFKQLKQDTLDIATMPEKELLGHLTNAITDHIQTSTFLSSFIARSEHNAFLIHAATMSLADCVCAISEMVRAGGFRPHTTEIAFGRSREPGESLGDFTIELSDGRELHLDGKIDRIDIARDGDKITAAVFDYKRTGKSLSWRQLYHGLDLQLPIYVLAALNASKSKITHVAGAFYLTIEAKAESSEISELDKKAAAFGYKAKGFLNGDFASMFDAAASKDSRYYSFYVKADASPYGSYDQRDTLKPEDFDNVVNFAKCKIRQIVERLISGAIAVSPYRIGNESPCGYCDYRPLCRFDWQINDYNALPALKKPKVLEKLGAADG